MDENLIQRVKEEVAGRPIAVLKDTGIDLLQAMVSGTRRDRYEMAVALWGREEADRAFAASGGIPE